LLFGLLKASLIFLTDLSRSIPDPARLDFIELAATAARRWVGHELFLVLRILDSDHQRPRRHPRPEDVSDTGLTLNYLVPRSSSASRSPSGNVEYMSRLVTLL